MLSKFYVVSPSLLYTRKKQAWYKTEVLQCVEKTANKQNVKLSIFSTFNMYRKEILTYIEI